MRALWTILRRIRRPERAYMQRGGQGIEHALHMLSKYAVTMYIYSRAVPLFSIKLTETTSSADKILDL